MPNCRGAGIVATKAQLGHGFWFSISAQNVQNKDFYHEAHELIQSNILFLDLYFWKIIVINKTSHTFMHNFMPEMIKKLNYK